MTDRELLCVLLNAQGQVLNGLAALLYDAHQKPFAEMSLEHATIIQRLLDKIRPLPGIPASAVRMLLPDCMMPDGGEACKAFSQAADRLQAIGRIIEIVDSRCMAVDGPVTPTLKEMTQDEISRIYALARGREGEDHG